jgi:hypothetical protein
MPLTSRVLKVTIGLPSGDVVLDQSLSMRVFACKAALSIQNSATIEVVGMSTSLRLQLISQFTAWHKRQVSTGQVPQDWIPVTIEAGYADAPTSSAGIPGSNRTATVFVGHIVDVKPTSAPPNIGVRIQCYTRQVDKTSFLTQAAPTKTTFQNLVKFASQQMGFGNNFICQTSYNDKIVYNGFRTIYTVGALLLGIQDIYRPDVAAFIDNDQLIVKDRNAVINPSKIEQVNEFIGTPLWNEWGVEWQTLMDPTVNLAGAANLTSLMNPGVNGMYVITQLEYQLSSREEQFYVKAMGSPPA